MVEAVRTTTSTFGIWAIIVVAVILLGVWLVGISIADNVQTRESRRWKQLHRPEPESALGSGGVSEVPGQRRGDERVPERSAVGRQAAAGPEDAQRNPLAATVEAVGQGLRSVLNHNLDPGRGEVAGHEAVTDPIFLQQLAPETETKTAAAPGRHARSTQRTGDADRAQRTFAGPDADRQDDDTGEG